MSNDWVRICAISEIPVLGARRVARKKGPQVAIFRPTEHSVHALLDRCPHKAGPLSQGVVFGQSVSCPLHNWTIALTTGQAQAPDEGCTPVFSVKLVDGEVWLDQRELDTVAIDLIPIHAGPCAVHG